MASANREWDRCSRERKSLLALQAEESTRVQRATARERHQRANNNKMRMRCRKQQRVLQARYRQQQQQEPRL